MSNQPSQSSGDLCGSFVQCKASVVPCTSRQRKRGEISASTVKRAHSERTFNDFFSPFPDNLLLAVTCGLFPNIQTKEDAKLV